MLRDRVITAIETLRPRAAVRGAGERMLAQLDAAGVPYRVIEHAPQGRTDLASELRGHPLDAAAKSLVLVVKAKRQPTRVVLAVVTGNARVDFEAIEPIVGGTFVAFAPRRLAERLTGCPSGAFIPFSFRDGLPLIADAALLEQPELFFNAGRLDRSIAIASADWLRVARPRVEHFAAR